MNELPKHIQQTYEEEFHRPEGSIPLLTQHEAQFIRSLARLNYFKEHKQNETTKRNNKK